MANDLSRNAALWGLVKAKENELILPDGQQFSEPKAFANEEEATNFTNQAMRRALDEMLGSAEQKSS